MTCIVGLEIDDGVIMGGDSAAVSGNHITPSRLRKVFRRGDFLIGYSWSFRMGQLLQYKLDVEPQEKNQSDLEYMATVFVDAVRKCLKDGKFTRVEDEQEQGGRFLVGYRGRLYLIDDDFQVNSSSYGYDAIGCGKYFALGGMWAAKRIDPVERVGVALEAAGHFSGGVCAPYYIEELK